MLPFGYCSFELLKVIRARNDGNDELYKEASSKYGSAVQRLARGYEADPERRGDLLQEIHFELCRSLSSFDKKWHDCDTNCDLLLASD